MNSVQKSLIINKGYNPYLLKSCIQKILVFTNSYNYLYFLLVLFLYLRYTKEVFVSTASNSNRKKRPG
jgi:hypothetical protein